MNTVNHVLINKQGQYAYLLLLILVCVAMIFAGTQPTHAQTRNNTPVLEQLSIPATGVIVQSSLILQSNTVYTVEVSGTYRYDIGERGEFADAQYREDDNDQWTIRYNSVEFDGNRLDATEFDLPNHRYQFHVLGRGQPLRLRIYDSPWAYGDNEGSLNAAIISSGYVIAGSVLNAQGEPLASVTVADDAEHRVITDAAGAYRFGGLSPGAYTLMPTKPGYVFTPITRTVTVPPDADAVNFIGTEDTVGARQVVVLVHGWQMDETGKVCGAMTRYRDRQNFPELADWLHDAGFDVWSAHLDSNILATPSLATNAACLERHLHEADFNDPDGKVVLIAHSMGGLVSRAYIESDLYRNDVDALITLGSPHQGIELSVLVRLLMLRYPQLDVALQLAKLACSITPEDENPQAGVCQFTSGMNVFNSIHSRRPGVDYYTVSGALSFWDATWVGRVTQLLIEGPDDGVVPLASGLGLGGVRGSAQTGEGHHNLLAAYDYFHPAPGLGQSDAYAYCIRPVLSGNRTGCDHAPLLRAADAVEPSMNAAAPIVSGRLQSGETFTQTFALEQGAALFAASWRQGEVAFYLTNPAGQIVDPAYAVAHPDEVSYLASQEAETVLGGSYLLANATPGMWTIYLNAIAIPPEGAPFTLLTTMHSSVSLAVRLDQAWYTPGQTVQITATLTGQPGVATVDALIYRPDGVTDHVPLLLLNENLYAGVYLAPIAPGYATVHINATGQQAGMPYAREEMTAFQIASQVAELNGNYADRLLDADNDGRYEALIIDVGVQGKEPALVGVSAQLVRPLDRRMIATAATTTRIAKGIQVVSLIFDGKALQASDIDGPYLVSSLLLADQSEATAPIQEVADAWLTAAYDHTLFDSTSPVYLPMIVR